LVNGVDIGPDIFLLTRPPQKKHSVQSGLANQAFPTPLSATEGSTSTLA